MSYRKFSEQREAKRSNVADLTREQEIRMEHNEITSMLKAGELLFSVVLAKYEWNAVMKALHNPNKRRKKKREVYDDVSSV